MQQETYSHTQQFLVYNIYLATKQDVATLHVCMTYLLGINHRVFVDSQVDDYDNERGQDNHHVYDFQDLTEEEPRPGRDDKWDR